MTATAKEAACLGVAILAGKAVGIFPSVYEAVVNMTHVKEEYEPNLENKETYDTCYSAYKELFGSLDQMFDRY